MDIVLQPPVEGFGISQYFGELWDKYPDGKHKGVDYLTPEGTPVKAAMGGVVKFSGEDTTGYGTCVMIQAGKCLAIYGHLSAVEVRQGDQVLTGDLIGESGNTGNSTGPHLHFEVRWNGVAVDPLPAMVAVEDPVVDSGEVIMTGTLNQVMNIRSGPGRDFPVIAQQQAGKIAVLDVHDQQWVKTARGWICSQMGEEQFLIPS